MNKFNMMSAFDTGDGGKWKLDENGNIVIKDGDPVYLNSDGKEQTIARDTIARLNSEAATNRKRAETAEQKLTAFNDIDPEKARKAIETVSKIDAKKLIDAGEVDKVRAEIEKQYTAQLDELKKENDSLQGSVKGMTLDNAFNGSTYIKDNIAVPVEMVRATFADKHFKVEDQKVNAYDAAGNRLMSKKSIGAYAEFDEAIEILVDAYPHKEAIIKAVDASGSGSGGGGGGRGGGATITTAAFDKLTPAEQAEAAAKAGSGELTIID